MNKEQYRASSLPYINVHYLVLAVTSLANHICFLGLTYALAVYVAKSQTRIKRLPKVSGDSFEFALLNKLKSSKKYYFWRRGK